MGEKGIGRKERVIHIGINYGGTEDSEDNSNNGDKFCFKKWCTIL
jgi:hypothetical protein